MGRSIPVDRGADWLTVDYATGAFILCRVSAMHSVGGFDESFFLYCEEEDLARRLRELGWQTLLVPSAVGAHEHSTSSEGVDQAVMAPFYFHSLYRYYRRYHSRGYAEARALRTRNLRPGRPCVPCHHRAATSSWTGNCDGRVPKHRIDPPQPRTPRCEASRVMEPRCRASEARHADLCYHRLYAVGVRIHE